MKSLASSLPILLVACGPAVPTAGSGTDSGGGGFDTDDTGPFGSEPDSDDMDWPDGFDPRGDVGDGVLAEPLLLAVYTDVGPLYVHMFAERLGDTFQASAAGAVYDGEHWGQSGNPVRETGYSGIEGNAVRTGFVDIMVPAGSHPYGSETLRVDLLMDVRLYDDRLLCGFTEVDHFASDEDDQLAPFVAIPIDLAAGDAEPHPQCD